MVSPLDVVLAYRWLLGRDPESADVVREKVAACSSVDELRRDVMRSLEFRRHLRELTG